MQIIKFSVMAFTVCVLATGCTSVEKIKDKLLPEEDPLVKSAKQGDVEAQHKLGTRYLINEEHAEAIYWLCSAGKNGHAGAQFALGVMYENWELDQAGGTLDHLGSAYYWYTAAASQGHDAAFDARDRIAEQMTPEQVQEAKRRATRWKQAVCIEA